MVEWYIDKNGRQHGQLAFLKETGILDVVISTGQSFDKMAVLATEALLGIPVLRGNVYHGIMYDSNLRKTYFKARPESIQSVKDAMAFRRKLPGQLQKDLERLVVEDIKSRKDSVQRTVELYQWNYALNRLHESQLYKIFKSYRDGKCALHISHETDLNYNTIRDVLMRAGYRATDGRSKPRLTNRLSSQKVQLALDLVRTVGYNAASRKMDMAYNAVRRLAMRNNVASLIPCFRKA